MNFIEPELKDRKIGGCKAGYETSLYVENRVFVVVSTHPLLWFHTISMDFFGYTVPIYFFFSLICGGMLDLEVYSKSKIYLFSWTTNFSKIPLQFDCLFSVM